LILAVELLLPEVLEGPLPLEALVPVEPPEKEDEGDETPPTVGRAAYMEDEV
jgi:hypothetical protein